MIKTINSVSGLLAAFKVVTAGDTILLAAGTYDSVEISNINFTSAVTITSADPNHKATLTNLSLNNSAYLAFQQLNVTTSTGTAAAVTGSNHISFTQDIFSGTAIGSGNAMTLRTSDSVTVTGSNFGTFGTGINVLTDSKLTITNNVFHDISGGDIRGTGLTSSTITGNTFSNANGTVANHLDVIDLWQDNAANHVVIDANIYRMTTGSTTTPTPSPSASTPMTISSGPQTVTVSSTDQLMATLKAARAGDTIKLAVGTYNSAGLYNLKFTGGVVTIVSADPSHQAVLSNLSIANSSGMTFQQVNVSTAGGTAASVTNSDHITFSQDTFSGSGVGSGNAIMLRSSDNITITGSDFGKFGTGVNLLTNRNLTITNNTFHDISDGDIRGTGVLTSTISGNTFQNAGNSVANHVDVLYLWQDNTANNVSITGNTFGSSSTTVTTSPPVVTTPPPGVATPVTTGGVTEVNTISQLLAALSSAPAGGTIKVDAGTYDGVTLSGINFSSAVTITSADSAHHAVFTNLDIEGSSGLTFDHVSLGTSTGSAITVGGSSAITFNNDTITGSATGSGNAMLLRNDSNVSISGSDIGHFGTGINVLSDSGVTISNNTFHDISNNGIRGTALTSSTISGNTFADTGSTPFLWQDNTANHVTLSNNTTGTGTASVTTSPPTTTSTLSTQTSSSTTSSSTTLSATSTSGHTVTVTNTNDLMAALANAHAGDTIKLAAGTYDPLEIYNTHFSSNVTITSADPAHEATLKGIDVEYDSGLAFDHLNVAVNGGAGLYVADDQNVSFSNMIVSGPSGTINGLGATVRSSSNISISNSEFSWLGSGIGHLDDTNVTISGNNFHDINVDGIVGAGTQNIVISSNSFTNFHPGDGDHPDAIQFFADSSGVEGSNVVIADNVITRGTGGAIQGIFIQNTNNMEIVGNAVLGGMTNAISLSEANNVLVSNNFVQGFTDLGQRIIVRDGSANVTVSGNAVDYIANYTLDGDNPGFSSTNNTIINDASVGDGSALNAWLSHHTASTVTLSDPFFLH